MEQNLAKRQKELTLTRCLVDCSARSRRSAPNALVSVEESLVLVGAAWGSISVRPLFHSPLAPTTPTVERPWLCGQTDRRDNARPITGSQKALPQAHIVGAPSALLDAKRRGVILPHLSCYLWFDSLDCCAFQKPGLRTSDEIPDRRDRRDRPAVSLACLGWTQ